MVKTENVVIFPLALYTSLGGFTALVAAIGLPEQVVGLALLNSAGQFGNPNEQTNQSDESILQKFFLKPLKEIFQRVVLGFLFWQAKQPSRIESVLKSVSYLLFNLSSRAFLFQDLLGKLKNCKSLVYLYIHDWF